jgi:hypothetical protein
MTHYLQEEQQRKADLAALENLERDMNELDLTFKERWANCKDFNDGNDYLKMKTFQSWVKNGYKPDMRKLKTDMDKLKQKYGLA